jgi:hypothetical protein
VQADTLENEAKDMCLSPNVSGGQDDLSLMWYVATPDEAFSTFDYKTG